VAAIMRPPQAAIHRMDPPERELVLCLEVIRAGMAGRSKSSGAARLRPQKGQDLDRGGVAGNTGHGQPQAPRSGSMAGGSSAVFSSLRAAHRG